MTDTLEKSVETADGVAVSAAPKRLFIKTYGCQMNVYDSDRMTDALSKDGYQATDVLEEADLVLLNTCHIREKAAEKVYSDLGRLRPYKEAKPDLRIGVAGCVAQAEGAEIMRRMPLSTAETETPYCSLTACRISLRMASFCEVP